MNIETKDDKIKIALMSPALLMGLAALVELSLEPLPEVVLLAEPLVVMLLPDSPLVFASKPPWTFAGTVESVVCDAASLNEAKVSCPLEL